MKFKTKKILAAALMVTTFGVSASIDEIMRRAEDISRYQALLAHSEANIRLSALDTMLKSSDTTIREIAYAAGISSVDDVTLSITLRNRFNELNQLTALIHYPERMESLVSEFRKSNGDFINFNVDSYNESAGSFRVRSLARATGPGSGSINGLSVSMRQGSCSINASFTENGLFEGMYFCTDGMSVPVSFRID
ncbi:hypothetical protein QWY20_13600 [Alkalimonas sp. MEB108]|uniref:Uncharacterized protein n=1 Tax=Alkalimonas cellulosilytica TaxID=3058395 RepID=A0ABU7J820_9GAMM|nr:hypothetical protein [Alkalimonas sp. MEB108]MEE2002492.1 hypothetical protein [Alkalimonas sp. MEB108]